jgi:hypothetical protein
MKSDCVIFDIDGVLANNDHRAHHLAPPDPDWDAFHEAMDLDDVYQEGWNLVRLLRQGYAIVLITGRPEKYRPHTVDWLDRRVIMYSRLVMRPDADRSPGWQCKSEMIDVLRRDGYDFKMVFEDNSATVDMYRARDIPCYQPRVEGR